jgi:hypothetical protein
MNKLPPPSTVVEVLNLFCLVYVGNMLQLISLSLLFCILNVMPIFRCKNWIKQQRMFNSQLLIYAYMNIVRYASSSRS